MNAISDLVYPQATLGLALPEDVTFDSFITGANGQVVEQLKQFLQDPVERVCFLWGEAAAGKTHLLRALCYLAANQGLSQVLLPLAQYQEQQWRAEILQGVDNFDLVCIDDLQAVLQQPEWEEALFHYYNRFLPGKSRCVFASHLPPNQLPIQLADLRSRLNAGCIYQVKALSEEDKLHALQQQATLRGLKCPPAVAEFILTRCGRDMSSLISVMRALDDASLAAKRPLTIPFVKTVLRI